MEKTTAPNTEARSTSFTPKLMLVFANISKEKARAGKMLREGQSRGAYVHVAYEFTGREKDKKSCKIIFFWIRT